MNTYRTAKKEILCGTYQLNEDGTWSPAVPLPYYYGFFSWAWKRLTGWRDAYGRKAHLFLPWH